MSGPRTLVVLAHPEPGSFTAAWAEASRAAAARAGPVRLRDLYGEGFDPLERPALHGAGPADVLRAQDAAARAGRLPAEVAAQAADLLWADRVILHFPMWWFAPPAMLKGWCDRVLAHGLLHDSRHRFDTGRCRGKRVLFCVSTGSSAAESGPGGKEGDARLLLWPLAYTLRYCGFDICAPLLVHGVHGFHPPAARAALEARLAGVLAAQAGIVAGLAGRALWRFNRDDAFDGGRLRPGEEVLWPFIDPGGAPRGG